ncbi:MAG: DUF167 domain-containing protein [Candidatus Omnitrophota bacterium]
MVKISVKVKAGSKQELVEQVGENQYVLRVKEKAVEGRANKAVVELLSEYFNIPKSAISIAGGFKSKNKLIAIKNY